MMYLSGNRGRLVDQRPSQGARALSQEELMGFDVMPKYVTFDMNGTLIKFCHQRRDA